MKIWMRLLLVIALGLITTTYFYPLWRFELWAPQYPEGLSMEVWTTKFSGDVRNINILNHYVGMQKIEAENFPELKLFPYALGAFIALGAIIAVINSRRGALWWSVLFLLFSAGALADFYIWEYRFGHELSEDAAIKMEDQVYQPPFIGSRTLLSITAKSYPVSGGIALASAGGLTAFLLLGLILSRRKLAGPTVVSSIVLVTALIGCQTDSAQPILFGQDECHVCKMKVSDKRFGGELVTETGKVFKFDSLDCMIPYLRQNEGTIAQIYVVDALKEGTLVKAKDARFIQMANLRSPMGKGVLGSADSASLKRMEDGAALLSWAEVLPLYAPK